MSECVAGVLRVAIVVVTAVAMGGCAHFVVLHDPLTASEHNDLGVAYETSGQISLAAKEYRQSLRRDSRQSRVWVNLGNVRAAKGQWGVAEKAYRHALRDSATNADAMNNLAVALVRQNRNRGEARGWAVRAVEAGGERDSIYRATLNEIDRPGE